MNLLITWHDKLNLGIEEIDQHHRKLVDLINVTYDSYINNLSEDTLQQVLKDLTDYAFVHFKYEEKYFKKYAYEDTLAHTNEHDLFLKRIDLFKSDNRMMIEKKSELLVDYLKSWLEHHILHVDKKYVSCFLSFSV